MFYTARYSSSCAAAVCVDVLYPYSTFFVYMIVRMHAHTHISGQTYPNYCNFVLYFCTLIPVDKNMKAFLLESKEFTAQASLSHFVGS